MALQENDLLAIYRQSDKTNRNVTVKSLLEGSSSYWSEDSGKLYPTTLTNNVGIGTDSPETRLQVTQQSDDSTDGIRLTRAGQTASYTQWVNASANFNIGYSNPATTDPSSSFVTVTQGGNVGIGTDSPGAKLTVRQDQAAYSLFDYYNTTVGGGIVWRQITRNAADDGTTSVDLATLTSGGFAINNQDTDPSNFTSFGIGGQEAMRITSDRNVGIGTNSPRTKLEVKKGSNGTEDYPANLDKYAGSVINATDGQGEGGLFVGHRYRNNDTEAFQVSSLFTTGSTNSLLTVKGAGNVGIGTDSPDNKLTIDGGVGTASGGGVLGIRQKGDTKDDGITLSSSHPNSIRQWLDGNSTLNFLNTFIGVTSLALTKEGNVGIGTDSPAEKLHVNGTTKSKYVDVTVAPNAGDAAYRSRLTEGANAFHMYCDMDGGGLIALRSSGQITAQGYDLEALPALSTAP